MESSLLGSCPHWRSHKNHTRSRSICRRNGSLQAVRGWLERNPFFPKDLPGNRETPHSQPSSLSARVKYTQARFCGQVGLRSEERRVGKERRYRWGRTDRSEGEGWSAIAKEQRVVGD